MGNAKLRNALKQWRLSDRGLSDEQLELLLRADAELAEVSVLRYRVRELRGAIVGIGRAIEREFANDE